MKIQVNISIFLVLTHLSISACTRVEGSANEIKSLGEKEQTAEDKQPVQISIKDVIGVLSFTEKNNTEKFNLYNKDGSIWKSLSLNETNGIQPFAWSPDYYLLVFKCVGKDSKFYHVVVDESSQEVKQIKIDDLNFNFQTLEDHILNVFSVEFNPINNPLKESSSSGAVTTPYDENEFYHPVEIKGEWLKVKWGNEGNWSYAWVKWKNGEELIIELYYFA